MNVESFIKAFKRHHPEVTGEVTLYHPEEGQNVLLVDGHNVGGWWAFMYSDVMLESLAHQWGLEDDELLLDKVNRLVDK